MIQAVRSIVPVRFQVLPLLLVTIFCGGSLFPAGSFAREAPSSRTILVAEIDRMLERTLPEEFSGDSRGLLGRRIEKYRKALRRFRTRLDGDLEDRNRVELFDPFESVLEAGMALREEQYDDLDDRLDRLREDLEEQREAAEDAGGSPRVAWIETYDRRLRPDDGFQRHRSVLMRAFGLFVSGSISSSDVYRFESGLRMAERLFPSVLQELFETDSRVAHHTRLYVQLLELLEDQGSDLEDPSVVERFRRHVRRAGGTVLRLERVGTVATVPGNLEETIRRVLDHENR